MVTTLQPVHVHVCGALLLIRNWVGVSNQLETTADFLVEKINQTYHLIQMCYHVNSNIPHTASDSCV